MCGRGVHEGWTTRRGRLCHGLYVSCTPVHAQLALLPACLELTQVSMVAQGAALVLGGYASDSRASGSSCSDSTRTGGRNGGMGNISKP